MKNTFNIPFNKPHLTHKEMGYISHAHSLGQLSGDGYYTKLCHLWLERNTGTKKALLTNSCTSALEMMAILIKIVPGDEVIMPSFTFTSTANAIVLRGGIPVFVDIRPDTLNIDENLIEAAITPKTKAIFVVHYAGVSCEMDKIKKIAKKHQLFLLEDAAQGILSNYKGQALGTIGDLGAYSFHETKNVISGEGGALLLNQARLIKRAEIIREKGTNRNQFQRGETRKYSWVDIGSSYLPGEIIAAFLLAQLEEAKAITKKRLLCWNKYHEAFKEFEKAGRLRRPTIPAEIQYNGHLYYIILENGVVRKKILEQLEENGILAPSHYVPLHSSKAGKKYGRSIGKLTVTNRVSNSLIRLPLFFDITNQQIENVIKTIKDCF